MGKLRDRKAAINKIQKLILKPKAELDSFRAQLEDTFANPFLPNHVECQEKVYGNVRCDFLMPEVYSSRRIIIYVHGGSFAGGSRDSYRIFCASLANAASCRLVLPEFRLPPTYPFPASIEDVQTVFRMVYSEEEVALQLEKNNFSLKVSKDDAENHAQIILAADSSGASIALACLLNLPEKYRAIVKTLILFSPWLDLSSENELIAGKKIHDEVLSGEDLHRAVDLYTYAMNLKNPLVSPLLASWEKYVGFPPVYIQMGQKEILLKQVEKFEALLKDARVEVIKDVWPKMMFMFQMADEYLPQSHLAIEKIGKYISQRKGLTEEELAERDRILKLNDIIRN